MNSDEELRDAFRALAEAQAEVDRLAGRDGLRDRLEPGTPPPEASHEYLVAIERLAERSEHYQRVRERT
jgi:hypothetical protein